MSRYLTPEAKAQVMERWAETRADAETNGYTGDLDRSVEPGHQSRKGGCGYVDRGVLDLCDRLNALDGVVTLQSCEGHRYPNGDESFSENAAGLWLWLDRSRAREFYERAASLAEHPRIEQIRFLWGIEGREIVDVIFDGVSRGKMHESSDVIVSWFEPQVLASAHEESPIPVPFRLRCDGCLKQSNDGNIGREHWGCKFGGTWQKHAEVIARPDLSASALGADPKQVVADALAASAHEEKGVAQTEVPHE
jgi:hypothetical protein